jgi:hypothetical protein
VEVTTSDGHVLVYCNPSALDQLIQLLAKLDFREDEQGERYTRSPIGEVARLAATFGGIAIPAHIGRDNTGFLTKTPHRERQAIFESRYLLAVELDGNAFADWFTSGDRSPGWQLREQYMQMRAAALAGTPAAKRLARLVFSDAHTLDGVGLAPDGGDKLTRIKMEHPSFDGLVAALMDPNARVVLEDPLPGLASSNSSGSSTVRLRSPNQIFPASMQTFALKTEA